jgi:hypothetical protein
VKSYLWLKSFLALSFVLILASCGTTTDVNNTSSTTIVPGKTECENDGDVSPDGKYVCAGHGMFYWLPVKEVATPSQTMEERYRECVDLKDRMRGAYAEILESLAEDDTELWAWFALTNSIQESRRSFLSQDSISIINKYKDYFDNYQILQCELNFPVLKDPEPDSNSVPEQPWTPSAIV